jgi:hypothetical protein
MTDLEELVELFGEPPARQPQPGAWDEVEQYVGSTLPGDYKTFMDLYGTGEISGELVVFHPQGSAPLLARMCRVHETFGRSRSRHPDLRPYPIHPEPGGLVSWGFDHSGDEHFFLPCDDKDPNRWKIVTMIHEVGAEVFEGSFTGFVLAFVKRLRDVDRLHGLDPDALEFLEEEDIDELVESGEIGPTMPSFKPL